MSLQKGNTTPSQSYLNESPLIQTKISIPHIPREYVHRLRLTSRIDRGVMGAVTLLAAPAGFGKSNLLVEWSRETDLPVAWLNIDSDDNDTNRFYRYMIAALRTQIPQLGEDAMDFLLSARSSGLDIGLSLLVNEIAALPQEIVLVLDDFHTLENNMILQNIDFILKHMPNNLHLIIAGRNEPALDLISLRAKGRVVELGLDDLRFTNEEVVQFFQQSMQLQIPTEIIRVLEERTDGWITGLQLAALSLQHQSDPAKLLDSFQGDAHYLADFLAEEVLDRQPEEIRQFLLRSSFLDTLNGSLCDAVVKPGAQTGYGTVMLNRLEHAKLFITSLDDKHEWYRYHPLFADFLRHIQSEINPDEVPELQKRAALWFEKNADLDKAFQYALASGDVEWAANLIEQNIETMIKTGEIFSLTHWIGQLPEETIKQRPALSLAYAWGLIAAYQLDDSRYWIDNVRLTLYPLNDDQFEKIQPTTNLEITEESEGFGLWNIHGGLAICQSTLALLNGDLGQSADYSKQATTYLRDDSPFIQSFLALDDSLYCILSGDTQKAIDSLRNTIKIARQANNLLAQIIATCQLAEIQALQGQLSQAWSTLQKARLLTTGPEDKPLPLSGLVDVEFGEILFERDQLKEAGVFLERGSRLAQSLWSISSLDGLVSLARLHQAQNDIPGTQMIIEETYHMALSTESSQWDDIVISAVAVRLALQRRDLLRAELWWRKGGFPKLTTPIALENYPYHIFEYLQLTQARFLFVIGEDRGEVKYLHQALDLLDMLLLEAERFQRLTSQIEILVLQSMIQFALKDGQAVNILLKALELGEPEGYRRIYLEEGLPIVDLLNKCQSVQQTTSYRLPSPDFIKGIVETIQKESGMLQTVHQSTEPRTSSVVIEAGTSEAITLTARELEVLNLIAEGKSNKEISSQLYLALNTVKRHAYNIYSKLDVKNRTQAISKARNLGLIP